MSNIPTDLRYTDDDEWVRLDGDIATIGITDFAQDSLSDIVYLELPEEGDSLEAGDTFGVVESVKAASDLVMPISGAVTAVNEDLVDDPETINTDPYGEAWMIKVQMTDPAQFEGLLTPEQYTESVEERK